MIILYVIVGFLLGLIVGSVISRLISENHFRKNISQLEVKKNTFETQYITCLSQIDEQKRSATDNQDKLNFLTSENGKYQANIESLNLRLQEQKTEMEVLQKKMTTEFENLANKIFKSHSNEFAELNQKNIGEILNPLKEKIKDFEQKIQANHDAGIKENATLHNMLENLKTLNTNLATEASNLTKALKSDTKKQGNWGELILENILESSGLVKNQEYFVQQSASNNDDKTIRPDVLVKLPENKYIIVDSKVSLTAYTNFIGAEEDGERTRYLKLHLDSVRSHIKILSEKKYQEMSQETPDFVLIFMPIESAFSLALQNDSQLFQFAWDKRIVLVSPTTLMVTLRTIYSIWRQEKQSRNAMEIARIGGALYDKFIGFLDDLTDIGKKIDKTKESYTEAYKKLYVGKGNIISNINTLKKLGAKADKSLPDNLSFDEDNENVLSS